MASPTGRANWMSARTGSSTSSSSVTATQRCCGRSSDDFQEMGYPGDGSRLVA